MERKFRIDAKPFEILASFDDIIRPSPASLIEIQQEFRQWLDDAVKVPEKEAIPTANHYSIPPLRLRKNSKESNKGTRNIGR